MMKRLLVLVTVIALLATAVVAKDGTWAIYGLSVPAPEHNDTFDNGIGIEGQYRLLVAKDLEIGFMLGLNRWEADSYDFSSRCLNVHVGGDVTDLSVGVGLLWKLPIELPEGFCLSLEGNAKHHLLSSDVDVDIYAQGLPSLSNELQYDNLTTVGLGANLEIDMEKDIAVLFGVGYQLDIGKEDVKLAGFKLPLRNGLEGVVFKAGIVIKTP